MEVAVFWNCAVIPCDWEHFSEEVLEETDAKVFVGEDGEQINGDTLEKATNKKIHFALYHAFTYHLCGK